jgi:hypothetical protein
MVADPFFSLKIAHFKATIRTIVHPYMYCNIRSSRSGGFCYDSASNPLAILGTSLNVLGDRWHFADVTEKNQPKSAGCGISGNARWHIAL